MPRRPAVETASGKPVLYPASWRHLPLQDKALWYDRALETMGPRLAFSINLSHRVAKRVDPTYPNPIDYLRRRMTRCVEDKFGRSIPYWMVLEYADHIRPHLHGAVGVTQEERKQAEAAFRKLCGSRSSGFRIHVVHSQPIRDKGWGTYCTKDAIWTAGFLQGSPLFRSQAVGQLGKHLYNEYRNGACCDYVAAAGHAKTAYRFATGWGPEDAPMLGSPD